MKTDIQELIDSLERAAYESDYVLSFADKARLLIDQFIESKWREHSSEYFNPEIDWVTITRGYETVIDGKRYKCLGVYGTAIKWECLDNGMYTRRIELSIEKHHDQLHRKRTKENT